MIELLTGVPGSGKTYFAVDRLIKAYEKKDRPIFTNINLTLPYDDILQPLDVKDFHEFCQKELEFFEQFREIQSQKRKDDPEHDEADNYDEALKNSGLLDKYGSALIFWDECHNDLDTRDSAYVRWMSYHRHFEGMDVLLITQSLSLIDRKYKGFIDKYYFGVNAAKRLFSTTFKYKVYTDHREYEKFFIETISLPSSKKTFSFYDSGHYKVNRSAAFKKLAPIAVLVLFIALFTKYYLFGVLLGGNKADEQIKELENNSTVIAANDPSYEPLPDDQRSLEQMKQDALNEKGELLPPPPLENASMPLQPQSSYNNQSALNRYLIRFQCSNTYCYFSQNRFTIPIGSMERFFEEFQGKILSAEMLNRDISIVTALVPAELYYMIEAHNIVSRSDNYGPQSQKNNTFGNDSLVTPQFVPTQGI
jgi:zona occludens toxin